MIILDTNVVSEPMKPAPDLIVLGWLDKQSAATLYLTSISLAELRTGVAQLPDGRRKVTMSDVLDHSLIKLFDTRILPFDKAAAEAYASIAAQAQRNGKAIAFADGQIAAIALLQGFTVATRDTGPFEAAGVSVVNPWIEG